MRMLVLKEDYVGACLVISDCTNDELQKILEKAEQNDENGIGQPIEEICDELFPDAYMQELGCTEQMEFAYINELNTECVAYTNYLGFNVVTEK